MREMDFTVSCLNSAKKDFLSIGSDVESSKIEDFIANCDRTWNLRIRQILTECIFASATKNVTLHHIQQIEPRERFRSTKIFAVSITSRNVR
jgi:hypothetical protein